VLFAEGGGGRPGDVDMPIVAGLHVPTFARFARLSGHVPVIAIVAGRCFAGNAALAGCSDILIATRDSNLGMGGPAMIEGGGLGVFAPEQIGPAEVLDGNGVIDILCDDEAAAVAAAKRYLGFLQPSAKTWACDDQAALRDALPLNRVRAYDVRTIVETLVDHDALLELRPRFGPAILTFLTRIAGHPVGMLVSQSSAGGGAIDGDAADKAAHFLALCDRSGLPIVSLIDTPGFMVGPDVEARGQVRHAGRLFIANAQLRVPLVAVVLRKAYGLGAMVLTGGGFHAASAIASWPTGEFGAMGLEGAVRLGYRRELEAVAEGPERDALYERLVASQYERGSAINMAATLEIDAVIDPADTRSWIARRLGFM
jgi:acetyl-CoA carboxylase carboxyltransferase component